MPCVDFFLERMHHPDIVPELHHVDHPKGVAAIWQGHFENTGPQTLLWLDHIGLATFGGDRKCC